jgi:TonB family protein
MIVLEFIIFVVSSGLFCSERFRNHIWAVLIAGLIATGSSLLFMWDLGVKMAGHQKEPPVITRIVKVPVVKTVLPSQAVSTPKDKPHACGAEFYPADSLAKGEEGSTKLSFKVLTDGTVDEIKIAGSSGSPKLDEAAITCVKTWHYRPAIKDGRLAEVETGALVNWVLPKAADAKAEVTAKADEKKDEKKPDESAPAADQAGDGQKSHSWYDPRGWFSSSAAETDKKQPASQP